LLGWSAQAGHVPTHQVSVFAVLQHRRAERELQEVLRVESRSLLGTDRHTRDVNASAGVAVDQNDVHRLLGRAAGRGHTKAVLLGDVSAAEEQAQNGVVNLKRRDRERPRNSRRGLPQVGVLPRTAGLGLITVTRQRHSVFPRGVAQVLPASRGLRVRQVNGRRGRGRRSTDLSQEYVAHARENNGTIRKRHSNTSKLSLTAQWAAKSKKD